MLYSYVLSRLQFWIRTAQKDSDRLLKRLLSASDKERGSAEKNQLSERKKAEKCKAEVDGCLPECMRTGLPDALQSTISVCLSLIHI